MENIIIVIFCFFLIFLFFNEFFFKKNNFQNIKINQSTETQKNITTIYFFNASWCGHCLAFKPEWNNFVNSLLPTDYIKAVDVNCDDNTKNIDLINKYKIDGFPTIIIETNNNYKQYVGPRTKNGLRQVLLIEKSSNLQSNDIKLTIYNFNTISCKYSILFQPIWDQFTDNVKDPNIKIIDVKCDNNKNIELCNKFNIEGYPTVVKEDNLTNSFVIYNGPRTLDGLMNFIKF
jgi:thiol-disulfide isomerase/thioredoxin